MTYPPLFLVGACICYLSILFVLLLYKKDISRLFNKRENLDLSLKVELSGLALILIMLIFVPTYLIKSSAKPDVSFYKEPSNFEDDAEVNGVKWKSYLSRLGVEIKNNSDQPILDANGYLETDLHVMQPVVIGGYNSCQIFLANPFIDIKEAHLFGFTAQGSRIDSPPGKPAFDKGARFHCDKIAPHTDVEIMLPLVNIHELLRHELTFYPKRDPIQASLKLSWISNWATSDVFSDCFKEGCKPSHAH